MRQSLFLSSTHPEKSGILLLRPRPECCSQSRFLCMGVGTQSTQEVAEFRAVSCDGEDSDEVRRDLTEAEV